MEAPTLATKIYWKKGKTIVPVNAWLCPCGGMIEDIGGAGCSHDDNWTYFGQCASCKRVFTRHYTFGQEDMERYGWKRVTEEEALKEKQ